MESRGAEAVVEEPREKRADLLVAAEPGARFDRRPDPVSWMLTPVLVLLLGPALAFSAAVLVANYADNAGGYPALCQDAIAGNRCEETVLRTFGWHIAAFVAGWLALWAVPWRRGLRPYRIVLGLVVALVLIAAPLRLLSTVDGRY